VNLYGLRADLPEAVENDDDEGNVFSLAKPRKISDSHRNN
jgi:hypothetical protein